MSGMRLPLTVVDLGTAGFDEVWARQLAEALRRKADDALDELLLSGPPPPGS